MQRSAVSKRCRPVRPGIKITRTFHRLREFPCKGKPCIKPVFPVCRRSFQVQDNRLGSRSESRPAPGGEIGKSFSVCANAAAGGINLVDSRYFEARNVHVDTHPRCIRHSNGRLDWRSRENVTYLPVTVISVYREFARSNFRIFTLLAPYSCIINC